MKHTLYFDTTTEVTNYFPNGVPSNVIAIVGDGSNVFVSSDNSADGQTQQYYNADLTNDDIVAQQVETATQNGYNSGYSAGETAGDAAGYERGYDEGETAGDAAGYERGYGEGETAGYTAGETAGYNSGYTEGETAGYNSGYAAGQAAGGSTNWLDVLYLDKKAEAEAALNVSSWSAASKYNFALDTFNGSCVDPQTAPALIAGVLQDATIAKIIKISKDQNDNAIITYHNCYINFNGTNLGAISLDGTTYTEKMCIWSEPLTLAVDDEIIMDVATSISSTSQFLFGGYDPDAYEMIEEEGQTHKQWKAATYKCTTAGTYTFGMTIDIPQAPNPQAIAFVSTMFSYEGQSTVPAIAVPTGDTTDTQPTDYLHFHMINNEYGELGQNDTGTLTLALRDDNSSPVDNLQYSYDKVTWIDAPTSVSYSGEQADIYLRGLGTTIAQQLNIGSTHPFNVSGNILSLAYGEDYYKMTNHSIKCDGLFTNSKVHDASGLILPTICEPWCYNNMFFNCDSLTQAPILPATTMKDYCYQAMFYGCSSLAQAPELPATALANCCYNTMFQNCTSLTTAPELPATTLVDECYINMFNGCTSLIDGPVLPAPSAETWSYGAMFEGCNSLQTITCLATDNLDLGTVNVDTLFVGVPETGTLYVNPESDHSIWEQNKPEGWTIEDYAA